LSDDIPVCADCGDVVCADCGDHTVDCQCGEELLIAKLKRGCVD
jgi:hypothetical protein